MEIGKAFSFPFEDEQWVASILICGALMLLPIIGWLAIGGYTLETARNVALGNPRPLPKWNNFGEKLSLGASWFVIYFVYSLPIILLSTVSFCAFLPALSGDEAAAAVGVGLFFCLFGLGVVLSLLLAPFVLAATARYLQTNSLGEAFKVGTVAGMVRRDLGGWIVLWLLGILCGFVAQLGGYVVIGIFFTLPYAQAVFGHLLGQMVQRLGRPAGYDYAPPAAPTSF
jgi:hypothetical protein